MQAILGAGGPVSNALASILSKNTGDTLRLVSRRSIATAASNVSWAGADLKDYDALIKAAKGSDVVYITAGLKYDKQVWKEEWPLIMRNIIQLGKETGARLIFFDNVYMYGHVRGAMTESTPNNPASVKGEIRARTAELLMEEAMKGNIRATIARSPDFYGTGGLNSPFDMMVLKRLAEGKSAQWLGDAGSKHSYIYIPDAAMAVALLGGQPESDNQIWHLPTAAAITGNELVQLAADALGVKAQSSKVNLAMLKMMGLFNKLVAETAEMYYQFRYDYIFDSSKFEQKFGMKPTPYAIGIKEAAQVFRK